MARFGKNMKVTADEKHRALLTAVYGEVLGIEPERPSPTTDLYRLADGFLIGVFWVDGGSALGEPEMRRAPWLEIEVEDVARTREALAKLGIQPFEYVDREHLYFQPPGGPIFRLSSPASA